ncbi:unnamed protein product [Rotaria magnacalcarata]|uniref:Reverse transcriptase domain-containing protein n=2 Tax=Rotaria TaxID=231623 RepID=A0A815UY75_9BILA|nr:unnamed protein product [Rotaria magnacalcarata]
MAEGVNNNNNGHNNDHLSGNEYEILEQRSISNVQVESISRFLSECPEAALSVHKFLQTNYSKSNQQQQIVQPVNSTPKRGHPLDESGSSINNGRGRRKYPRKGIDSSAHKQSQYVQQEINLQPQQPSSSTSSGERQHQVINQASTNRKRISFNQLKHAVSSNLPCFFIEFTSEADRHSIPTALQASDLILKELQSKGVLIKKFTLVGWSGKKLKLGVNNKEDYATLVGSDKWPTKINGIDIVVAKPKYVPDSFALVVRYVPRELEENFVSNEIQRTIASADRIKRIHYSYQRRTDDYRFDVKDYSEYNAVLQLGRIAIGHSWLSITKFYPGNRLTYCTKCWCLGHLRNKCNSENKCRICLENLSVDTPHMCKNEPKCAQCDGNHHSLDSQCQVIKEYKDQLKEDVEDAIQKGFLQRLSLQEKSPVFELCDQDFPPLTTSDNHSKKQWNIAQPRTSDTEKAFESINDNLAKLIDSNKRLENKVDLLSSSMKTVTLDTQLHQAVLADTINIMKDFIQYFIRATLISSKSDRVSLVPVANEFYNRFHVASSRLINGFQLNHQVQLIPTSHNNNIVQTDQQSSSIYNSTQNAKDEAMHRLITWNFSTKDQKLVISLLDEWYSGRTLNTVLEEWEKVGISSLRKQKEYLKILCYNVEGWGTRAVEAIDLVYKVQASICIFTEVGELWNTCRLPHFNTFYQKGTNKNGGVCIAVGKHLKATRIEINIPNTVIIDITGLSEPVRIIGIYWPTSQQRDLDEIQPFVIEGTILSGDFNATVKEWNSPITDRRVPPEQSGFRPKCLLPTRVLSIYQEVKNSMAANIPTFALYVDYQKAYDRVWHAALLCKLERMGMPFNLLKMTCSWLKDRKVYVEYGEITSKIFNINIGLPQGSSLSPYLFIVFHADLTNYPGAHSCHLFADDLCVLIKPPIMKSLDSMIEYLEKEGTRVCNQFFLYSKKWKQPLNVSKTVVQLFHTQVKRPVVSVTINGNKIELVKEFKYLGFTWTDKLSLKPTVDKTIGNIQRSL